MGSCGCSTGGDKGKGLKVEILGHTLSGKELKLSNRRGQYYDIEEVIKQDGFELDPSVENALNAYNLSYRTLCSILFNFVPKSGHPGGSISSGHIVASLLFKTLDYDFSAPNRKDADMVVYAAGHKAMGLYTAWALRNECVKAGCPEFLPHDEHRDQLRLEDLLGFRRNPTQETPLFKKYKSKSLDGHPAPLTPFIRLATGASGVGDATGIGLGFAALDYFGEKNSPYLHLIEGEAGLTPGRVQEVMASAATAQMKNIIMHIDWNQASIDSNRVTREGDLPGDYVQWTPLDLAYFHDWNVIWVPNGFDFKQVLAAQQLAKTLHLRSPKNKQPIAIVYRTVKGWKYGIEGKSSHGAGHELCSSEFYQSLAPFEEYFKVSLPRLSGEKNSVNLEQNFFDSLLVIRKVFADTKEQMASILTGELLASKERVDQLKRVPRENAPNLEAIYYDKTIKAEETPTELKLLPGKSATLRGVLADSLAYLNRKSRGAIIASSADLFGSTSTSTINQGLAEGYFNLEKNPLSRLLMVGGICEDGIGGVMSGISSFGQHIGVGTSYGAFIAALQHITARLHAIGQEAKRHVTGEPCNPFFIVCAHAGPKTGEDGPTHADPQAYQIMSGNFPKGLCITLTPSEPQEIWPLVIASLKARPAVIVPYVSRPAEVILDRASRNLPPAWNAVKGVYALRKAKLEKGSKFHGSLVVQGNSVAEPFLHQVMPKLEKEGYNFNIYYVSSPELFELLSDEEKSLQFPAEHASHAMGITEFTLPTMYQWIRSDFGRSHTLYTFKKGHYMGSGQAHKVLEEAGLSFEAQFEAIVKYGKSLQL